jgi:hypothetical protein
MTNRRNRAIVVSLILGLPILFPVVLWGQDTPSPSPPKPIDLPIPAAPPTLRSVLRAPALLDGSVRLLGERRAIVFSCLNYGLIGDGVLPAWLDGRILDATNQGANDYILSGDRTTVRVYQTDRGPAGWKVVGQFQSRWKTDSGKIAVRGNRIAVTVGRSHGGAFQDADLFVIDGKSWAGPYDSPSLAGLSLDPNGNVRFQIQSTWPWLNAPSELGPKSFSGRELLVFDVSSRQFPPRAPLSPSDGETIVSAELSDLGSPMQQTLDQTARPLGLFGKSGKLVIGLVSTTNSIKVIRQDGLELSSIQLGDKGIFNGKSVDYVVESFSTSGRSAVIRILRSECSKKLCTPPTSQQFWSNDSGSTWAKGP